MRHGQIQAGAARVTAKAATTAVAELAPADPTRLGTLIYNTAAAALNLFFDAEVTIPSWVVPAGGQYSVPDSASGLKVSGSLASGTGNVNVTEFR